MRKIMTLLIFVMFLLVVFAYNPPPYYSANITLGGAYTPPPYYSANITLGAVAPSDPCDYTSGNYEVSTHCNLVNENYQICPNIINITEGGWINASGTTILNASKIIWTPKNNTENFRLRWVTPAKVIWGGC